MQLRSTSLALSLCIAITGFAGCSQRAHQASEPTVAESATPTQTQAAQMAAAAYDFGMEVFHPVQARHGMVASEQELATQIGVNILKAGGNAVDAAVAVGFALAVVLPNAGNIGGGGFMMVHDAKTGKGLGKPKILFLEFKIENDQSYPVKVEGEDILVDVNHNE